MTYKQARAELLKQAAQAGQVLTPQELRMAADYMVKLWRQQQDAVTAPDFSPEAVERMLGGDDAANEPEPTE